eukprot:Nitzschia sp. Nitz4//scaffold45_size130396//12977//14086//NITZ4_003429-RA/size130396-snap-gene-0.134-mRNA-1//-1//CDS//3329552338//7011//frame0
MSMSASFLNSAGQPRQQSQSFLQWAIPTHIQLPSHHVTQVSSDQPHRHPSEDEAAQLLLSISRIVSKEIQCDHSVLQGDDDSTKSDARSVPDTKSLQTPNLASVSPTHEDDTKHRWNRIRSVSIDSPTPINTLLSPKSEPLTISLGRPALISPNCTPVARRPIRSAALKLSKAKDEHLKLPKMPPMVTASPVTVKDIKKKALAASIARGKKLMTIGRKKFSWKNYPELEAFLIANREEYLRHSALNYTVQQKQYNNRLTEQLLELAAEHGYIFDEVEFSFVTVRDRIRCYFKSYVQSAKKRGITVGYAARKAGLLSDDDLRVEQEGQIIVPPNL